MHARPRLRYFGLRLAALLAVGALVAAGVVAAGSALAWGSGETRRAPALGDPGVFMKRVVTQVLAERYEAAWSTLHPAHQRVASRAEYVSCELLSPIPGVLDTIRVLSVRRGRAQVAGQGALPARAVTIRFTLTEPSLGETAEVTHTFHAVAVGGSWRWILPPGRFETYRADACRAS
jgi:hypothetical protein